MRYLDAHDLRVPNESVLQLNSDNDAHTLPQRLSLALGTLISCDFAAVECFGRTGWKGRLLDESRGLIEKHFDAFLRLGTTHPLFPVFKSGVLSHKSFRLSDVITPRALQNLDIYNQFLKPISVDVQMAVSVPLKEGAGDVLILSRQGKDFSLREKERLTAFLPHIILARRHSLHCSTLDSHDLPEGALEREPFLLQMQEKVALSRRESEVTWWMVQGKSDRDIADICEISCRTVGKHCENIYRKLGVECRTAAVSLVLRNV